MNFKIVISGGPCSGKTTIINQLILKNYNCFNEISRTYLKKRKFIDQPISISKKIINKRIKHYIESENLSLSGNKHFIFFDRGIHEVAAYLDYLSITHQYHKKIKDYQYNLIFILELNKKKYTNDNQRIETFEQALKIEDCIKKVYQTTNHTIIYVPWMNINNRLEFILYNCYKTFKI